MCARGLAAVAARDLRARNHGVTTAAAGLYGAGVVSITCVLLSL